MRRFVRLELGFPVTREAQEWAELKILIWEGGAMVEV